MSKISISRLRTVLMNTGLQTKDNSLFQIINQLIGELAGLEELLSGLIITGGGSGSTNINTIIAGALTGDNNGMSSDEYQSMLIPGARGATGANGISGNSILGMDGSDGIDAYPIPGARGIDGKDGIPIPGIDGLDADSLLVSPGGVYQILGTALQITVNTSTGIVTISLPANITLPSATTPTISLAGSSYPQINIDSSGANGGVLQLKCNTNTWQIYNQAGVLNFFCSTATAGDRISISTAGMISAIMGSSTGFMTNMGVADIQTSAAGIGNGADTTDDTLFTYTLPINAMSVNGKSLRMISSLKFNAISNTTYKVWFAGTAIYSRVTTGTFSLFLAADITRIDSTHVSCMVRSLNEAQITENLVVVDLTANTSILKITGANVASTADAIKAYFMKTWFEN